jgi:xylan 1,4-beta-xylosidase
MSNRGLIMLPMWFHSMLRATPLRGAVPIFILTAGFAVPATAQLREVQVDASAAVGELKQLRGVSGAPDITFLDPQVASGRGSRPRDVSEGYRMARVNLFRTHDSYGTADIDPSTGNLPPLKSAFGAPGGGPKMFDSNVLFPNVTADPENPRNYNWGPTDNLINTTHGIGADVLFRLGREGMTTAPPPRDLKRYHEIVRRIVLHYNKGWADGFSNRVKYWEVWNEPDLGHIWWRGTPQEYYEFYAAAAKAVKSADAAALVGGPTIALVNETTPYREGFLAYVRDHQLPLDFFSWHWYSTDADDPYDFVRIANNMRTLLDSYGFTKTLSVLDEWNSGMRGQPASSAQRAGFVASALVYMQDAPIDLEMFYRADGQFGKDGKSPTKTGQVLIAFGRMADTPNKLRASGGDTVGFAVEAGRSADGRTVQVLISNYEIPSDWRKPRSGPDLMHEDDLFDLKLLPRREVSYANNRGYRLRVTGLLPHAEYEVERYRLTDNQDFALLDRTRQRGSEVSLSAELPPPSVELIVLRRVESQAPQGP